MRVFVRYLPNGIVIGQLETAGTPGATPGTIPDDFVEVTDRTAEGPFIGTVYNKVANTFTPIPEDTQETNRKAVLVALLLKPNATWGLSDVAAWLKNSR